MQVNYEICSKITFQICYGMLLVIQVSINANTWFQWNKILLTSCLSAKVIHSEYIDVFWPHETLKANELWIACVKRHIKFNTLRPWQNRCHFPDDIFKYIFLNKNAWILIKISLKLVPKNQWWLFCRHICVTRPQWVTVCLFPITILHI